MSKKVSFSLLFVILSFVAFADEFYINSRTGNDAYPGNKIQPLKTIAEAARRVNSSDTRSSTTIILQEGIYPLTETVLFNNNKFSAENRLIIKAEKLPDDPDWNPQCMPILTSIIPTSPVPNNGEESKGIDIEVNHVTIEGLRFTGSPLYYYIDGKQNRRYYPIWRNGKNLDDLLVTQCLFTGNVDISPIRVAVIANGHGLVVDHCVFYNCQNPVVFWEAEGGTSYHNAMRYCLVFESNYSGVWTTTNTGDDFEFHNNIIANGQAGWIRDNKSIHHYRIHDCIFTSNTILTGNGGGSAISNDFLKMDNVQLNGVVEIDKDQGKKNFLQLKDGSFGSELKAGLFKK